MEKDKLLQKWINTPFAYTKFHHDLTLLQQDVLIKVSDRLQRFIQEFHGSSLKDVKQIPKPLFAEALRKSGIDEFHITFAELGVAPNNYPAVKKAVDEVLDIKLEHPIIEDGIPKMMRFPIFNKSKIPLTDESSSVTFSLNIDIVDEVNKTKVVDYVFDMSQGYVTHPVDIARISDFERMPMIYYLLRHESQNWKQKVISLTVEQIKEYLNMIKRDEKRQILSIAYPKFSKFRERVLSPAIKNINDLHEQGLIDVSIEVEFKYPGTRKTGDPEYILFKVDDTRKKAKPVASAPIEAPTAPILTVQKKRGRPRKNPLPVDAANQKTILFDDIPYAEVYSKPEIVDNAPQFLPGNRVGEWHQLVAEYGEGASADLLASATCLGTTDDAFTIQMPDRASTDRMISASVDDIRLKDLLVRYVGRPFKTIQVCVR